MRQTQILRGREPVRSALNAPVMQPTPELQKLMREHENLRNAMASNERVREEALKKVASDSYGEGFNEGCKATLNTMLAAVALAANKLYGFGARRCLDLLNATSEEVFTHLDSEDAIDEVWNAMGLRFVPDAPFDQVQVAEEKPNNQLKRHRERMPKRELQDDERSVIFHEQVGHFG